MKKKYKKLWNNKVINNTSWILFERIFQLFIGLAINMIIARYLGPTSYGIINYTASFIAFFNSICTLGLEGIIIKELIDHPKRQGVTLGSGIFMRTISSLISMGCIILIISILNPQDKILIGVAFLQSLILLFRSIELIDFWYQSQFKSKYVSIIRSITYTCVAIYKVIIVLLEKNIFWFAFTNTLDMIIIAILLIISYKKHNGDKLEVDFNLCKNMLKQSYHFILSGLMVAIYAQMDKMMIGEMLNTTSVGYYSVGIYLCTVWNFIPNAIITSMRPLIIEAKKISDELYLIRLKQLYSIIIWLSVAYALFITVFGKQIILILYGNDYLPALTPLLIAVWYCGFSLIGVVRDTWMILENKQKYSKIFAFLGAITNLILNIILIPLLGITGAAIATLITQIMTGFIATLIFKETRINNKYLIEAFLIKDTLANFNFKKSFVR